MTVLETLTTDLPTDWLITDVYVGSNWIVSLVINDDGVVRAGMAATPEYIAPHECYQRCNLNEPADIAARRLLSQDLTDAAIALATFNAINQPAKHLLTSEDAAEWLAAQCGGQSVAIFGRFPFINTELRPVARQVWVFEQQPQPDEFDSNAIPTLVPQADIVAITGSSVINHSIDSILPHIKPGSIVVLLGPSTPLSEKLFALGLDAMFGVLVTNVQQVIESVVAGDGFQKMKGLQRVALLKRPLPLRTVPQGES